VKPPRTVSVCGFWTCGSPESPARNAIFGKNATPGYHTKCAKCFGVA
jgi:hypothetical protein